jgi:hypothetical protein
VRDIRGLERYRWSGYAALAGTRPALAFESVADSLSFLDPDPGRARARLGSWMGQALELPVAASPTASPLDERDLRELVRIVCERAGISEADLLQGSRDRAVSRARALLCYLAVAELGLSGRQVARALGVTPGAVSQSIQRGRSLARLAGSDGALF